GSRGAGGSPGAGWDTAAGSPPADPDFTDRLVTDEVRRDIARFRQLVASEARRRAAESRGRERMTRYAVRTGTDRVDFLAANQAQLAELRSAVQPLSRKLATRLAAQRRRHSRGTIDVRRTLRRSMSTGGVPLTPAYRKPRPSRPELVLLCDVSGSVAGFSGFTMLLVRALSDQFSKVRVFAFVNAMDEVTDIVRHGDGDLSAQIVQQAQVTRWHGSSDYGEALGDFAELYLDVVGARTSVLVLGDARTNYGDPNLSALARIAAASRRTHWLNPERVGTWGQGDSVAHDYARIVEMHECRTVEQLSRFIGRLLPV
ncbi:MAG: VWA domain-containing protein, partial [Lapillicoccus sp.]